MLEPNVPVETDAGKVTEPETVQIAKAELEGLQANQRVVDDIQERAEAAGFENFGEYIKQTESWAYENISKDPEPTPDKTPVVPKVETPVPVTTVNPEYAKEMQELTDKVNRSDNMSTAAFMQTCFTDYDAKNRLKPEDRRSAYSKDALLKVINGPRKGSVQYLISTDTTFGGNPYMVADYMLNQEVDSKRRKEEGDKSEAALAAAATTATIDSTTATVPVPETEQSENDKQADLIAPSDAPIE